MWDDQQDWFGLVHGHKTDVVIAWVEVLQRSVCKFTRVGDQEDPQFARLQFLLLVDQDKIAREYSFIDHAAALDLDCVRDAPGKFGVQGQKAPLILFSQPARAGADNGNDGNLFQSRVRGFLLSNVWLRSFICLGRRWLI